MFKFGDSVFHSAMPEWGPGTVTRAESIEHDGRPAQRLHVRFASTGLKTINTAVVDLIPAEERTALESGFGRGNDSAVLGAGNGAGWIATLEGRRPEEVMTRLPAEASDPFRTLWQRLQFTLDLYRFSREPRALTQWAVAQSGMADPLTRFARQELEILFDRWARNRDGHLKSLLFEASRTDSARADEMLAQARPEAKQTMQRLHVRR